MLSLRRTVLLRRGFSSAARSWASQPVVVQKYGGTSVGGVDKLDKVHGIVERNLSEGRRVVAVVSAMSPENKADGTTSRLLSAANAAVEGRSFAKDLIRIEDVHMDVLYGGVSDASARDEAREILSAELRDLTRFLESLTVIKEISGRSLDRIVGCGERLSAALVSASLRGRGVPSVHVDLSDLVDDVDPSLPDYQSVLVAALRERLERTLYDENTPEDVVPVLTGFFGHVSGGIVDGVGRGYTDLTAALAAAALDAEALQVWKESDGVFTGNPTKIEAARLVNVVTPREAAELTYFGNEVLHPSTMECAVSARVPVHILNTFQPEGAGTVVDPTRDPSDRRDGRAVTAICSKSDVSVLNVTSNRKLGSFRFLARVFDVLMRHEIKVDLVSTTEVSLSITVNESTSSERLRVAADELSSLGRCTVKDDRAIVSLIGEGMKRQKGVAAQMFTTLAESDVNIEMIAQGSSEVNISAVVDAENAERAVRAVHREFIESAEHSGSHSSSPSLRE